jgi:predicted dehydrogenase
MTKAAIVGLGWWGRNLVSAAKDVPDLKFTAAHTRNFDKVAEFCAENGLKWTGSFEDVLNDPGIEAVVFATPHSQHARQVEQAAAAGKHVFVEKPFTLDSASARDAIAAVEKAGVVLSVGFNRRFHPTMKEMKERLTRGQFGTVTTAIAEMTSAAALASPKVSWRGDAHESPAGAMTGIGVHLVDGLINLFGTVRSVYCVVERRVSTQLDDCTNILLTFESGITGIVSCSNAATPHYRTAVYGTTAFAEIAEKSMDMLRIIPATAGSLAPEHQDYAVRGVNTLTEELTAFAAAIATGGGHPIPLHEIQHGVDIFEAVIRSAESGKRIDIEARPDAASKRVA